MTALLDGNLHHLGPTRMHPRPGQSGSRRRLPGARRPQPPRRGQLGFPTTYGYSNPTLTTVALAPRLADHLKTQRAA